MTKMQEGRSAAALATLENVDETYQYNFRPKPARYPVISFDRLSW